MTSSIGGNYSAMGMMQRPDPAQMASKLFAKLDTKNQGYIEKSDLQSALAQVSGSDDSAAADAVFKQFDGDSDGKITQDEMSAGFKKLAEQLDSQFQSMRMNGFGGQGGHGGHGGLQGMAGMPPPRGGKDAGFTKDELTSQLQEMGSSDSKRSSLISNIVNNFDQADTDGDGKVTRREAKAFEKASSGSSSQSGTATAESSEAKIMHTIMRLMHSYGGQGQDSSQSAAAGQLSVTA
ncbi:MAG TPA: EF-hand domain-containing protein [Rhodocyclaceae bacterium]|nr:EF-hand domain-containing protein [Rhodocyclaceae bacterium]